jgi:hypothetical protein
VADRLRLVLELGPKGRKVVAVAPDWPGLERGARTAEAAVERLISYLPRYAPVAKLADLDGELALIAVPDVVERYNGTGSTDFWGISFAFSAVDRQEMSSEELARELRLMRASWAFLDAVRSRVSAELRPGPRGGGRGRDRIAGHVLATERDWAKKLGMPRVDGGAATDEELRTHREAYCAAIQAHHADGKMARSWPLRFLVRHTAFHTLDHAWEMEDRDLTRTALG